jgi:hypothetical protein
MSTRPSARLYYSANGLPTLVLAERIVTHPVGSGPRTGYRWSRDLIVYAIDLWHRQHLEAPTQDDWERAGDEHPCRLTVIREFGTWNAAIEAAGLRARRRGENRRWARQRSAVTGRWCRRQDRDDAHTLGAGRPPLPLGSLAPDRVARAADGPATSDIVETAAEAARVAGPPS